MTTSFKIVLLAGALALSGCSQKQVYDNIQANQKQRCEREANSTARQECLKSVGPEYRDYQRERASLLDAVDSKE